GAGPDLHRHIVLAQVRVLDDPLGRVLAHQEVLAETLARREPARGERVLDPLELALACLARRPLAHVLRRAGLARIARTGPGHGGSLAMCRAAGKRTPPSSFAWVTPAGSRRPSPAPRAPSRARRDRSSVPPARTMRR